VAPAALPLVSMSTQWIALLLVRLVPHFVDAENPIGLFTELDDPLLAENYTNFVRRRIKEDGYAFLPDLPFGTAASFSDWWTQLFPARQFDYAQGAVSGRTMQAPGVYKLVAEKPESHIYPHIEAAYLQDPPEYMAIMCPGPCRDRTGTILASSERIKREVHWRLRDLYDAILQHGVTYTQYFPSEDSPVFETYLEHSTPTALRYKGHSRRQVELNLQESRPGAKVKFDVDGGIWCEWTLPGFTSTTDGPQKWSSSILLAHQKQYEYVGSGISPWQVRVGNRSVSDDEWLTLREIHLEEQVVFSWRPSSTLVWNNLEFHHGRPPMIADIAKDRVCFKAYAGYVRRDLALRQDVALAHRLMANHGITESIWTHLSAKLDDNSLLLTPFGLLFKEVNASSLLAVDLATGHRASHTGQTGGRLNPTALPLHRAVYSACDRCTVVIHAHHKALTAVSALKEGFLAVDQSYFGLPPIFYVNLSAVVSKEDRVGAALKGMRASRGLLVLSNHGVVSFGTSVAGSYLRLWYAVRVAEIQVMTLSMRPLDQIKTYPNPDDEESVSLFQSGDGFLEFEAWRRLELQIDNSFTH